MRASTNILNTPNKLRTSVLYELQKNKWITFFLISVFEDRTYTNLCVPAFMDLPSQNQPKVSNPTQENLASQNVDEMESNKAKSTNSKKWYSSPTIQKVAYSAFLHTLSGAIYGLYSIYLNISKPTIDEKQFFIAFGCYLLGIGLYLIFVASYYRVLIIFEPFLLPLCRM